MQNEERQITFNDIPEVLSEILKRFDLLDQSMELIREEVRRTKGPSLSDHIPMDVKEACEFLKIKKSPPRLNCGGNCCNCNRTCYRSQHSGFASRWKIPEYGS